MPRKLLVKTYIQHKSLWRKFYKGKFHYASNEELGLPPRCRKEDGYKAANEWWLKKQAELDGQPIQKAHPHAGEINKINRQIEIAEQLGLHDELEDLKARKAEVEELDPAESPDLEPTTSRALDALRLTGFGVPEDIDPTFLNTVFGRDRIWQDRAKRLGVVKKSDTAKHHADLFLEFHRTKAKSNEISTGRYSALETGIKQFLAFYGESRPLKEISQADVLEFNNRLKKRKALGGKGNSADYVWSIWQIFKQFMQFCTDTFPEIKIPANLRSSAYSIRREGKEPTPYSKSELQLLITNSSERFELYFLLMCNCGMTQMDIGELQAQHVDWQQGRIIRARSKKKKLLQTKGKSESKILKINWVLWDRTFTLLKKYGNRKGTVLLNEDGGILCGWTFGSNDKPKRIDSLHTAYERLKAKLKKKKLLPKNWSKPLKSGRQTGANLLEDTEYSEFIDAFMDHSSVAKKHYLVSGKVVKRFDDAVISVGQHLGFPTERPL